MRITFAVLIATHGVIHLLGAANAFGWTAVPQLHTRFSPLDGALWFTAALLLVATAISVALGVHWW